MPQEYELIQSKNLFINIVQPDMILLEFIQQCLETKWASIYTIVIWLACENVCTNEIILKFLIV